MKTKKIFSRIDTITMTFVTDTGETITKSVKCSEMNIPGLDCIHTVSSVIGFLFSDEIEDWVVSNPHPTPLQKAILSKTHYIGYFTEVKNDKCGNFIEIFSNTSFKSKKFRYDNYDDAKDDLKYCITLQNKIK